MTALDDAVSLAAAELRKASEWRNEVAVTIADLVANGYHPSESVRDIYKAAVTRRDAAWVARRDVYVPQQRGSES